MNRAERRSIKRDIRKAAETINKLNPAQVKIIDQVSTEKAQRQAEAMLISYQRQ